MKKLLLACSLWCVCTLAHASMMLDRTILVFRDGTAPRHDVSVTNPDNENLYLEVTVLDVRDPGTDDEVREPVKDPASIGLVAAPQKLMVPPGEQRIIRLVNLDGHSDVERVYRVNVTPVPPPMEASSMAIRVLIAYQLLIFVEPEKVKRDLRVERRNGKLYFHNAGNVNVLLTEGNQCALRGSKDCETLPGRRLYPGNRMEVELPGDGPVFYRVSYAEDAQLKEF